MLVERLINRKSRAIPDVGLPPLPDSNRYSGLMSPVSDYIPSIYRDAVTMGECNLLGLPAAGFCRGIYTGGIGQMMTHAHVIDQATGQRTQTPLLIGNPYLRIGPTDFWEELVSTLLVHGNYYALVIVRDKDNNPIQVMPIPPGNVEINVKGGEYVYTFNEVDYSRFDMLHIRRQSTPGNPYGIGILEEFFPALLTHAYEAKFVQDSYKTGGPSFTIELDTEHMPSDDEIARIASQFDLKYAGGARGTAVLPRTMKISESTWSPQQMDVLNRQMFSIGEMALMWQLNPRELGASMGGQGETYSNLEQNIIARHMDSYGSVLHRIEDAFTRLLPPGQKVIGNPDAVLKMDTKSRYEAFTLSLAWKTINEIRALDDLQPIAGGDVIGGTPPTQGAINNANS